jgi:high affinity sulfate transporter 1
MTPPGKPHQAAPQDRSRESLQWIPGVALMRNYSRAWLLPDLLAGILLTAILVPAGMGYAVAAGLPAYCGLYASILPMLAYAFFGPSRILILGPDSSLSALIAATILPLAVADAAHAIPLAGMLALLSGVLCMAAGFAKLGFLTELLSKPIRYGYINGISLAVMVGQLPILLGLSVPETTFWQRALAVVQAVWQGHVQFATTAIGLVSLAILLVCKRYFPRIPGLLLAVVGATVVVWFWDLSQRANVSVVGPLPQGLPAFRLPSVSLEEFRHLLLGAMAIALISFADTSVLSRTFALRGGYAVDANRELMALGIANVSAGLFQGFPISGSASRTPVAESAGAKTPVAGLVGALCIACLLAVAPALTTHIPYAVLGAVVVSSCLGLFEITGLIRIYRMRPKELGLSIVCFLGIVLLGVIEGIFLAIGLAFLDFIWKAWRPYSAVLGRVPGMKGYHDISRHPEAQRIPGLILFRWDAPLFFANAAAFEERVLRALAQAPTPTRRVVVAAEPVTDIDITAADMLAELDQRLHQDSIELCFAEMKGPVKDRLKRYGLFTGLGNDNFFPTIGQAVDRYVRAHGVDWRDWQDRNPT